MLSILITYGVIENVITGSEEQLSGVNKSNKKYTPVYVDFLPDSWYYYIRLFMIQTREIIKEVRSDERRKKNNLQNKGRSQNQNR